MSPLLRAALKYAAAGVPVLPLHTPTEAGCSCGGTDCDRPGKHPRWHRSLLRHGLHDASTRPELIRRWWTRWPEANVAARTGVRFDVCDVDVPDGVSALRELVSDHTIPGPVVRTGSGGWHIYLRPTGTGNRTALLPGVDWRGVDGYVVAPPSRHASGRRYRWIRPPDVPLGDCPAELAALLFPPVPAGDLPGSRGPDGNRPGISAPGSDGSGERVRHPERYASAALAAEASTVASAVTGTRNTTLYLAAYHLGQLAAVRLLDDHDITAVLGDAARQAGLGRQEIDRTIRSGLRTGHRRPRPGLAA
ncbi:bifunctional DNA primase/polymerase [Plantactinospora sp. S1510]|uniref:Bifunctional DNA primase/polymerase n=1 Tax=Plantactinospora alkalitolerans TaxID=2789879 RepID=A0ABS0H243_9ACTN|nr:bifunctional DNA primase/polymerase [Plantactinospora alkalitolerans]MBF9132249.1 bifunctional DNA primase/polymerase [Plantactinospora alkalitolerans]